MPAAQERRSLPNSEIPPLANAHLMGKADANEAVQVIVIVRPKQGAPPLPDHEYWMRTPPGQRKFLSPEDFAARYGADQNDINAVAGFGRSYGLTVLGAHSGRRSVIFTGTVSQMNAAFGVDLQYYEAPGPSPSGPMRKAGSAPAQTHRGYSSLISLPQDIADLVQLVEGLDNRRIGGHNTWTNDDPHVIVPLSVLPDVVTKYNFPQSGANGQSIGIVSVGGGYQQADVTSYFAGLTAYFRTLTNNPNLPTTLPPKLIQVSVNGGVNNSNTNDNETLQDICIAGTVGLNPTAIVVYFVGVDSSGSIPEAWIALLTRLLVPDPGDPPVPSVMTSSYWVAGTDIPSQAPNPGPGQVTGAQMDALSGMFQQLATRGITFFVSSGDKGSDSGVFDGKVHVQYPGSDPWVTSCGGTALGTNASGALEENVWNDSWTVTDLEGDKFTAYGATGGGVSDYFALPAWQNGAGVPPSFNDGKVRRGVPDIAGNASPQSGCPMSAGGQSFNSGGTSAVAPLYAGLTACIVAQIGQPIGFLNPTLYALGKSVFRDITSGNNLWHDGVTQNAYSARQGWDACTGLGVINGFALLNAMLPKPPVSDPCATIIRRLNQEIQALGGIPVSTAAGWKAQLLSCLRQGKITQAQYTAAINEIDNPPGKRL